jgi:hypothetical protein
MNKIIFLLLLLTLLMMPVLIRAAPVPDTGQTRCYDDAGQEIACSQPGQPFFGQDGNNSINPPSYTKLDADGNGLPDDAPSWTMVRDNVTGLIWEVKQNRDGVANYQDPHDADNRYTWYDSNPETNGGNAGVPGDLTDTEDFIHALNIASFGGHLDWRMPKEDELRSMVDYGRANPMVDVSFFPYTQGSSYWSSMTYANTASRAWCVDFSGGLGIDSPKSVYGYARAVRGGLAGPSDNLVANGDGTITDARSGLMWQQGTAPEIYTWEKALSYSEDLSLAGHFDWRLPTTKELASIVDLTKYGLAIDRLYFPDTVSSFYWSSTSSVRNTGSAWYMGFYSGYDYYNNKSSNNVVRAVRGGQAWVPDNLYIRSPSQASTWDTGTVMPITWETRNLGGNVSIALSRDGGKTFETLIASTPNDGSFTWTVSSGYSVNCVLKITPILDPSKASAQSLFTILGELPPDDKERPGAIQTLPAAGGTGPVDASIVVRVKDDDPGIDPGSGNMLVTAAGGEPVSGTFYVQQVFEGESTEYWYVFRPSTPFGYGVSVDVVLEEVTDSGGISMETPYHFSFQTESQARHESNSLWTGEHMAEVTPPDTAGGKIFEAVGGSGIDGAKIAYALYNVPDGLVEPRFVPNDLIPELDQAFGIKEPLMMEPPAIFKTPVKIFIPVGENDPSTLRLYYYDETVGWVAACDKNGNVLPGGRGWMVPGSRVDHEEINVPGTTYQPASVEIQVWHLGAVQAGVDACPDDPDKIDSGQCGCGVPDTDTDIDGIADCIDNCPAMSNVSQTDTDSDGLGDVCDLCIGDNASGDTDGDSFCNNIDADDDEDGLPDTWENLYGLNPDNAADAGEDPDSDGFSNAEEFSGGTNPNALTDFPERPEVVETFPHQNQDIDAGTLRVPHDTTVVVRVKDDKAVDPDTASVSVAVDSIQVPGNLVRQQVNSGDPTEYWLMFYPEAPFAFGVEVDVVVHAKDTDGIEMKPPYAFRFGIESEQEHLAALSAAPASTLTVQDNLKVLSADTGTTIEGAKITYSLVEPVEPRFRPSSEIPLLQDAEPIGNPVALEPPLVLEHPATLIVPCPGVDDVSKLSLFYYTSARGWTLACDSEGRIHTGGENWMVPGSRVNHNDTKTIEIQVFHLCAVIAADAGSFIYGYLYDAATQKPILDIMVTVGYFSCKCLENEYICLVAAGRYNIVARAAGYLSKALFDIDVLPSLPCHQNIEMESFDLCPDDPKKFEPGICGCGTPDTDTDNDGAPDCIDPYDDYPMGDIGNDGVIDLADAVVGFQLICGARTLPGDAKKADVNLDEKIGMDEMVFILQKVSGVR